MDQLHRRSLVKGKKSVSLLFILSLTQCVQRKGCKAGHSTNALYLVLLLAIALERLIHQSWKALFINFVDIAFPVQSKAL